MWNKGNLYGSSCTCMYSREFQFLGTCGTSETARYTFVAVRVFYVRVKLGTLVRFLLYVCSHEFTCICTCGTLETGAVLDVRDGK